MSRYMVHPDLMIFARRIRTALTPRKVVQPTDAERADDRLYWNRQCYVCLAPLVAERGVSWAFGKGVGQRFLFHAHCAAQVQKSHPTATLREMVDGIRKGRS